MKAGFVVCWVEGFCAGGATGAGGKTAVCDGVLEFVLKILVGWPVPVWEG